MFVGREAMYAEEFDGIDIRFEKLLEWVDQPAFTKNHEDAIAGRTSFEYKRPPTLKFTLGDGATLSMDFFRIRLRLYRLKISTFRNRQRPASGQKPRLP